MAKSWWIGKIMWAARSRSNAAQGDRQVIPPKLTKIAWNERYVIAEQQWLKHKNPDAPWEDIGEPQDLFYYWVVDTELGKAFGPYDKPAFELKKQELNLPESMVLAPPNSYTKPADFQ